MATPQEARAELAKRELVRRGTTDNLGEAEIVRIQTIIDKQEKAKTQPNPIGAVAIQSQADALLTEEERITATEQQLGGPLQRDLSGAPAEFNDPATRFDLARSNNFEEKKLKLEEKFPGIEVVEVDTPVSKGKNIAVRLPGEDFVMIDTNSLATFSDFADAAGS